MAQDLDARSVPFEYEQDAVPYYLPKLYYPDFKLLTGIVVEAKGYFTVQDRRMLLRVREEHPNLDLRMLFQDPSRKLNFKAQKSKTYGQWCDTHGFPWAQGPSMPEEWVRGL